MISHGSGCQDELYFSREGGLSICNLPKWGWGGSLQEGFVEPHAAAGGGGITQVGPHQGHGLATYPREGPILTVEIQRIS